MLIIIIKINNDNNNKRMMRYRIKNLWLKLRNSNKVDYVISLGRAFHNLSAANTKALSAWA